MQKERDDSNTWAEWSKHVILSIERLDDKINVLTKDMNVVHDEVIQVRTRSSIIWGIISAATGALLTFAILFVMKVI